LIAYVVINLIIYTDHYGRLIVLEKNGFCYVTATPQLKKYIQKNLQKINHNKIAQKQKKCHKID